MQDFLNIDISQISYAALFVWLLLDTTKKASIREDKLINALDKIVPRLDAIEEKVDKAISK